jgi:hypothetical protein
MTPPRCTAGLATPAGVIALLRPKRDCWHCPLASCGPPWVLQMPSLLPPATRGPPVLPATLTRLAFGDPPLRDDGVVALAAGLPLLQTFQLSRWRV